MPSRSTMFWPSSQSKGDLHQISEFRPGTLERSKSQLPPLTVSSGRQVMHHVP